MKTRRNLVAFQSCRAATANPRRPKDFGQIVDFFRNDYGKSDRDQARWFGEESGSISNAISRAVQSRLKCGHLHGHQRRLSSRTYKDAELALLTQSEQIVKCVTFNEIFGIVESCFRGISGAGELLVYDVSERLGWYRGLAVDHVYLHRGTREGASYLDLDTGRSHIPVKEFKGVFGKLTAAQIESVLCIYKADIFEHGLKIP